MSWSYPINGSQTVTALATELLRLRRNIQLIEPLSMNRGIAPKDSKRPRIAFLSSMNALNRWDLQDGSWPQCAFTCWRSRLPTKRTSERRPPARLGIARCKTPCRRPAFRFRGSKREVSFRRILTVTLSPSDGERESLRAFNVATPAADRA